MPAEKTIQDLINETGEAVTAMKSEMEAKSAKRDVVWETKLTKIETALDAAIEGKAAIEARIEAERKEREELELRLTKLGNAGIANPQAALEIKDFNRLMAGVQQARGRSFSPLDADGFAAYKAATEKYLREGTTSMAPEELKALSVGVDADGGYFVTPDISGRIVKKVYETSAIRQIASVQRISTDKLEGIEDNDEAGAGYAGEKSTSGNTKTPQVGKWSIPVFWIDTEPKTTRQLLDDAEIDVEGWLAAKVGDKLGRFENREFCTGATKIRGVASYATAADDGSGVAWGSIGSVKSGASGAFLADASNPIDRLHDLVALLKNAYLGNARWLTRRKVISAIRKFKDTTGQGLWQPSLQVGVPELLLGYPVSRAEDMPALAASSVSMMFGDFASAYQIVDRSGVRVIRDELTDKPYVKFYTTKRVGGGMVNFEAVKAMVFAA